MKTYGQILSETRKAYLDAGSHIGGNFNDVEWLKFVNEASEEAAKAVIEEFKRRHNIVIPPEED